MQLKYAENFILMNNLYRYMYIKTLSTIITVVEHTQYNQ